MNTTTTTMMQLFPASANKNTTNISNDGKKKDYSYLDYNNNHNNEEEKVDSHNQNHFLGWENEQESDNEKIYNCNYNNSKEKDDANSVDMSYCSVSSSSLSYYDDDEDEESGYHDDFPNAPEPEPIPSNIVVFRSEEQSENDNDTSIVVDHQKSSSSSLSIVIGVDGITTINCVLVIRTILLGFPNHDLTPIPGLVDLIAIHHNNDNCFPNPNNTTVKTTIPPKIRLIIQIDKAYNAPIIATKVINNLAKLGYLGTVQNSITGITQIIKSSSTTTTTTTTKDVKVEVKDVNNNNNNNALSGIAQPIFNWKLPCTCFRKDNINNKRTTLTTKLCSSKMKNKCKRHQQIREKM